jgi:ABC-type multidrug transport system fused ATPase/permease subunit
MLVRPWPLKLIFDYVLLERTIPTTGIIGWIFYGMSQNTILIVSIATFLGAILLEGFFGYRQVILLASVGQRIVFAIRRKLFAHIQRLSLKFHDHKLSGELVTNLTGDISLLRDMLVDSVMIIISQGIILIGMPLVMIMIDPILTLVALAVMPPLAIISFRFSFNIRRTARRQRIHEGRIASTASEAIHAIRIIQTFGRADYHDDLFGEQNIGSMKYGLRTKRLEANLSRIVEFIVGIGICGVLGFGAYRAKLGLITPGDLIVFMSYLASFYRPLRRLSRVTARISKAVACGDRVMEVLSIKEKIRSKSGAFQPDHLKGYFSFEDVTYKYNGERPALKNLNFRIDPGQFVGLVGPNGAGKSTVLSLMLRLYDPNKGKICIDGKRIKDYEVEALRERFGVILPEPILFQATVAENIAYGRLDAEMSEIEEAAVFANAHDFVQKLPNDYQTVVGETGATLSTGQRQRIAIARAFIKGFDILLLDEPLARLDAISIEHVKSALLRLRKDRTTVYAAHSLDELVEADKIFVLIRGRIVAEGVHEELLASCKWYRRVYKLQRAGRRRDSNL